MWWKNGMWQPEVVKQLHLFKTDNLLESQKEKTIQPCCEVGHVVPTVQHCGLKFFFMLLMTNWPLYFLHKHDSISWVLISVYWGGEHTSNKNWDWKTNVGEKYNMDDASQISKHIPMEFSLEHSLHFCTIVALPLPPFRGALSYKSWQWRHFKFCSSWATGSPCKGTAFVFACLFYKNCLKLLLFKNPALRRLLETRDV